MKKNVTIPTKWEDVTVRQFQLYSASIKIADTDEQKMRVALHTLCGMSDKEIKGMSVKDAHTMIGRLAFLSDDPKGDEALVQKFTLDGVEYGFIPNWTQLTLGEYIDLETYTSSGKMTEHLHEALGLMYRPITSTALHQYEIEPYEVDDRRNKLMLDLPMNIAVGAIVFFYTIGRAFATDMRYYLNRLKEAELARRSGLNGAGIE